MDEDESLKMTRAKLTGKYFQELKRLSKKRDLNQIVSHFELDHSIGLTDLAKIVDILNQFTQSEKNDLIERLVHSSNLFQASVGGKLLIVSKYWSHDMEQSKIILKKYSSSPHWQLRDLAAELLAEMTLDLNGEGREVLEQYSKSSEIRDRQLATNAFKHIFKALENWDEYSEIILPLLNDDEFLVRNNLAYYGLAAVGLKYHPDAVIGYIKKLLPHATSPQIREMILSIFTHENASPYLSLALEIVEMFLDDESKAVGRMRSAVLQSYCLQYKADVIKFLENRIDNPKIVDHWAILSADGLLDLDV